MELTDKLRDIEKKASLYQDRLKEYEEIMKKQNDEIDKKDSFIKSIKAEYEA